MFSTIATTLLRNIDQFPRNFAATVFTAVFAFAVEIGTPGSGAQGASTGYSAWLFSDAEASPGSSVGVATAVQSGSAGVASGAGAGAGADDGAGDVAGSGTGAGSGADSGTGSGSGAGAGEASGAL